MSEALETGTFRGGVLRTVAGVAPQTIHTWRLDLGESPGAGHRRYSAADAVAIRIMVYLMHQGVTASVGRSIVHGVLPHLPTYIARYRADRAVAGKWPTDGGPFAVVKNPRPGNPGALESSWLNFVEADEIGEHLCSFTTGKALIVIPLWRSIWAALQTLQQIAAGEIPASATEDLD